jgi:MerR family transcriptional regulator/heat shock protein HspR
MVNRTTTQAVYVISVAAELAGVHPQTLRIYERKGLLDPARTQGGNRRYSDHDLDRLRRIAELTDEGLNLAGVRRVLELEAELARLRAQLADALATIDSAQVDARTAVADAERRHRRDLVPLSQSVALYGRLPSIFRRD